MIKNYHISKVLNNNIVLATNLDTHEDLVLIGKGIGFGKKSNTACFIDEEKVEQSFVALDKQFQKDYYNIVKEIDIRIIDICEKTISSAEDIFGKLSDKIHILLVDHINFAIERVSQGHEISNPFIDEIRIIYPKEFEIAKKTIAMIEDGFGINLGYNEVGFIAMHLHSARSNKKVSETIKNTRIINELVEIIEADLGIKLDRADYKYKRLVSHIQGAMDRVSKGKSVYNPLISNIKKEFKESFRLISKIKQTIEDEMKCELPESELGYMAIHIQRLRTS